MTNTYLVSDLLYDNINLDQIEAIQTAYEMDKKLDDMEFEGCIDCISKEDLVFLEFLGF